MRRHIISVFILVSSLAACSEAQVRDTVKSVGQQISDGAARVTADALWREIQAKTAEAGALLGSVQILDSIKTSRPDISVEYYDGNGDGMDDDGKITIGVGSGYACVDIVSGVTSGRCP
jgi:hypothetical protein